MEHDEQNGMDPARIGRYIAGIVEKKDPAVVYVAGAQYKFLSLLCKLLPAAARGKIVGKIYRVTGALLRKAAISVFCGQRSRVVLPGVRKKASPPS